MVINGDVSIKGAAEKIDVAKRTLNKYVTKIRTYSSEIDKKGFDRIMHVVKFSTKMKKTI